MRDTFFTHLFIWCLVLGLAFVNIYAQQASLGNSPKSYIMYPDAECTGAGELIYDDGTFENGYGWNPVIGNDGRFLMLATPPAYPWQFNTFCVALTRNGASDAFTFDIIVYDNAGAGGIPGSIVSTIPGVTATGVPTWPVLAFYDFDISSVPALASGSYYLGIKFDAAVQLGFFLGSDESLTTPLWPGYASSDGGATWNANASLWPDYRAMGIRSLGSSGPPCPIDPATNPSPADGATDVDINLASIDWTNGAGADSVEVWFDGAMVYNGTTISTWPIAGPLTYATTYPWQIVGKNDTCSVWGPNWSFTTLDDPLLVLDTLYVYPQSVAYWTGTTDGVTKIDDSEVRCFNAEDGWMMFDISSINDAATINEITYFGYANAANWPYWSATPLPGLNPLTATAGELKTAAELNSAQGTAYIYSNEASTFVPGAYSYLMEAWTNTDLQAALAQDWFAMGMDSRDNSATYFINWDGWNQTNVPYLCVVYEYIIPVELTSFAASVSDGNVTLNWSTATETNNQGFNVERNSGNGFEKIGFVAGFGTSTEIHNYSYVDGSVQEGSYTYRLKQVDYDGTFEYSDAVEVDVTAPKVFALEQNYPNPFNPTTNIKFGLAADSRVTLTVFDILGQEVANLISGNLAAGSHEINFNASNINSGVYFYRINATAVDGTNFTSVKKMILTK